MNNIVPLPHASSDVSPEQPEQESQTQPGTDPENYMDDLLKMARSNRIRIAFPRSNRTRIGPPEVEAAALQAVEKAIDCGQLIRFRLFESFEFRTALYYSRADEMYYIALVQRGVLWYAIKTSGLEVAECAFRRYEALLVEMTGDEVRRTQLEVRNGKLATLIENAEREIAIQREDLEQMNSNQKRAAEHLHQLRKDIADLESRHSTAQARVNSLASQSGQLKRTLNNTSPRSASRR